MTIEPGHLVVFASAIVMSLAGASMILSPQAWARLRGEPSERVDRPVLPGAHTFRTQLRLVGVGLIVIGLLLAYGVVFGEWSGNR
jgi:uncharacterized protein YjeT (DUF2065 family)